jgi:hypothetical protein
MVAAEESTTTAVEEGDFEVEATEVIRVLDDLIHRTQVFV